MARLHVNSNTLRLLREKHRLSAEAIAEQIDISSDAYLGIESGENPHLSSSKAKSLADIFGVSVFQLARESKREERIDLPDFRTEGNKPARVNPQTWKIISDCRNLQRSIQYVYKEVPNLQRDWKLPSSHIRESPEILAKKLRKLVGVPWEKQYSEERDYSLFNIIRSKIDNICLHTVLKSYDLNDSRGFYLSSNDVDVAIIVVNRKMTSEGSRLFTLIHELAHACIDAPGLSDFTIQKNQTERFCNQVAAEFLMPAKHILRVSSAEFEREPDFSQLRRMSRKIGVSQYSLAIRFVELSVAQNGYVERWRSSLSPNQLEKLKEGELSPDDHRENDEEAPIRRSGKATRKLSDLGVGISSLALAAIDSGARGEVDIFRSFSIRPDQIDPLRSAILRRQKQVKEVG